MFVARFLQKNNWLKMFAVHDILKNDGARRFVVVEFHKKKMKMEFVKKYL
jgi:hypothetical protein